MSAKSSPNPGNLKPIEWPHAQPLSHVPRTRLPEVRELQGIEALRAWHAAGGDPMVLSGRPS